MSQSRTLLDWHAAQARDLAMMRANTAQWQRDGIIKTPGDVQVRAGRAMSVNPGSRRKAHAG